MENKRNERDNYVRHGLIIACIVCIIGVCFEISKVALAGAILLCAVQLVDLIWYIIEIKFKDCKNVKQAFCRCKDIEILNEWEGIDTKFGKCIKCGKYFMINEKENECIKINEQEYQHHVKMFNMISMSFDDLDQQIEELFGNDKKENKE